MQRSECALGGVCMSITRYLDEFDADPETKRVLAVALEMTRASLRLTDNLIDGIIAKQIVELAKTGERNPDLLCEVALKKYRSICTATSMLSAKCRQIPTNGRLEAMREVLRLSRRSLNKKAGALQEALGEAQWQTGGGGSFSLF